MGRREGRALILNHRLKSVASRTDTNTRYYTRYTLLTVLSSVIVRDVFRGIMLGTGRAHSFTYLTPFAPRRRAPQVLDYVVHL